MSNKSYRKSGLSSDSGFFEQETISISDIILVLARQLKVVIITPILLCTLMIIYVSFFTTPLYQSTAKIISSSGGQGSQVSGIAARFGFDIPNSQAGQQWVYPEVIKSRTLARAMLKRKFDTKKFGPQKDLLQILTYGNNKPVLGLDNLIKVGVDRAIGMIGIEKKGSFYDLTITAFEPLFARDFAMTLIEELDKHQRNYNKAKTSDTKQFILGRIEDVGKELNVAEEALRDFTKSNRRIENSPLLQLEQGRLAREVGVLSSVFTTLKQQLETTKIEEVKESEYVVVFDPPEAPLHQSSPNKKLSVILSGILGIGLGVIIAFLRELAINSSKKEKDKLNELKFLLVKNISELIPKRLK